MSLSITTAENLAPRIEEALESVRSHLKADGGDVRLEAVTESPEGWVVELQLLGACVDCSMSEMTLRAGVEHAIRRAAPEVAIVKTVDRSAPAKA